VKKIHSLSFLATLALGMISWGSALSAQTTPSTPTDTQTPQSQQETAPDAAPSQTPSTQPTPSPDMPPAAQQTPNSQAPDATTPGSGSKATPSATDSPATGSDSQVFSGTVTKQGDKYVLKDDSGKTYDIDHQDDVKKFEGKRVRVQGTLDSTGTKISVK
jgi:cytoskeletal protein RodZ